MAESARLGNVAAMLTEELVRYLREHPEASPVRAMRTEAATADQAMHSWVLCANGIESRL